MPTIEELEEENGGDWQEKFESYTNDATPDRLLDHCQQMQEDLNILRYWIETKYNQLIK